MSGSDPTGFSWLSDILNGNSSSGWEGSSFFGAALGVVGGAYITSLAQAGAFAQGGSLSGFTGTSGLGGGAAIVEAFAGLNDPGANETYAAPTGDLGSGAWSQGGLYNENAGAAPPRAEGALASSEVWAVHTLGTDYRDHVTTKEEAVAVAIIAASRVGASAIPALLRWFGVGAARGIGLEAAVARGTLIGQGARGAASGKMASIVQQVSALGLPQAEAAAATNAAVRALGLRTSVVAAGNDIVVSSVMLGPAKPILVVGQNGAVVQRLGDLAVQGGKFVVTNIR